MKDPLAPPRGKTFRIMHMSSVIGGVPVTVDKDFDYMPRAEEAAAKIDRRLTPVVFIADKER